MEGGDFMDDIGNLDFCGDLFDHIDDLLDFPCEDIEGEIIVGGGGSGNSGCSGVGSKSNGGFQGVWQPPQDGLSSVSTSLFSNPINTSGFPTDLPVPDEDIAQLEWLSTFVEDSFSPGTGTVALDEFLGSNKNDNDENNKSINNENKNINNDSEDTHRFQTPSPVSVLESSSSCSGGRTMPISPETIVPGRARTKRPRPTTFNHRPVISLVSPTSSVTDPTPPSSLESVSEFENFAESNLSTKLSKPPTTEQKKRKKKRLPSTSYSMEQSVLPQPMAVRKCLHCEITKTPQWRAGPLGPKTLCNACGVRYKSGRLFPEYRPAASPTFVPKLHSNSHKKVLEMRGTTGSRMTNDDEDDEPALTEFVPGNRLWDAYM